MVSASRYLCVVTLFVLIADATALGQALYPYFAPKLQNSKDGEVHDFPLGVLSATGRLQHGATAIAVKDVGTGGPGEQDGLQVGDVIAAVK